MKFNMSPVRGTVDYLPTETEVRSYAEKIILETYRQNGFLQIKTPILESLELLTNGDEGDNQKLMFKTIKRGDKLDLSKSNLCEKDIVEEGLRYDLTVPLVRFFANNKEKLTLPFKSIQIDEAFRAERPQKGRMRQFTQCDVDILGDSSPLCEIELMLVYMQTFKKLGFNNLTIKINDRRALNQLIVGSGLKSEDVTAVCVTLDKFDKIGIEGVKAELLENDYDKTCVETLLNRFALLKASKNNEESFKMLSKVGISSEVVDSLKTIIETAEKFKLEGFNIVYDATIIRGQGYYTGTVFEVYDEAFGRAIGGGGRYDKMVEKFIGTSVPAVGCSIGLSVVVMLMIERNYLVPSNKLALVYDKNASFDEIVAAKLEFIGKGFEVATFAFPKNFNNFAERIKANNYKKLVKLSDKTKVIDL